VTLAERHPQVSLHLKQGLSYETLSAVQRGELDCAYALSDSAQVEGLELRRLGPVDLVVTLPRGMAEANPELTIERLVGLPWVGTPPTCVLRVHVDSLFATVGREFRQGATADSETTMRSMIASGLGAGLLRHEHALQAERNGELTIWNGWRAHTWLCWAAPATSRHEPAVEAVRSAVLEAWA
jgi:DNA-binding transcriptional LysR family regulator